MKRIIKFRAWHKDFGEMVYTKGDSIFEKREFSPFVFEVGFSHYPESEWDVMQFTGLHDKNGVEIFDSDRLKRRVWLVEGKDYVDYNCDVIWNGWCYGLYVADKQLWGLDPITAKECEIIGNIYEKG